MRGWAILLITATPAIAHAHEGAGSGIAWTLTPLVTVPLALAAFLYSIGMLRLRRRSERGRGSLRRGAALFAAGWLTLAGALVSPLHKAGETSFTMHMIEHEIIMLVSALLLIASRPGAVLLWSLPGSVRRAVAGTARWPLWDVLTDPIVATAIQSVVIILWHVPWLFDLTLSSDGWHIAQHLSFIGSALLFWWAMLHGRSSPFTAAACLFATSMIGGGLGALMTFSTSPWYPGYAALGLNPAGLTPEQDQQLAGLIMWIPGGAWHLAAAILFLAHGLRRMEEAHARPR